MPYLPSLRADAAPPTIYAQYPEIYAHWSKMSQALMNGPSPIGAPERELLFAYAAGVAGCEFVFIAHAEVAYALGVQQGLVDQLVQDFDAAPAEPRLKALLAFVGKLMLQPGAIVHGDIDAVLAAGWDEHALHDATAIAGRAAFMHRLVAAYGFAPLTREAAAKHAAKRVERGYVNLYSKFREPK